MSSILSGGGRAYKLNLELIKPQTSSWTSNSSQSSSLSESNNSPLTISTRKTRTSRKRPNQTYHEAASILSTAYPKLFPTKHLTKPCKLTKPQSAFPFEPSSDLLTPFRVTDNSEYFLPILERPGFPVEPKSSTTTEKPPCYSPGEINSMGNCWEICDGIEEDDFDAGSMLDEDVEEGIDSIMGNLKVENEKTDVSMGLSNSCCYGYPVGLGFDFGYGMRNEVRAMRDVDGGDDWWRFPSVNVADIARKIAKIPVEKKKKKKNLDSGKQNSLNSFKGSEQNLGSEETFRRTHGGHLLKLNYDGVLRAWSGKGSPFSGGGPAAEGNDVQVRLAQIDLFPRDAIVLRYKEKRRSRLFSKKIRYQVRKVKADQRPRIKGRFVRSPNSTSD